MSKVAILASKGPEGSRGERPPVAFVGDRAALVAGLIRGDEGAAVAFLAEYRTLVERTAARILGATPDLPDVVQEVFIRALKSAHQIRDPQALTEWLLRITTYTSTDWLRARFRRRWLVFSDPLSHSEPPADEVDEPGREALRATYRVLDRMGVEDRKIFALRFIDGMELTQLAGVCECSLSTVKTRVRRAKTRFAARASHEPALRPWLEERRPEATR